MDTFSREKKRDYDDESQALHRPLGIVSNNQEEKTREWRCIKNGTILRVT